MPYIPCALTWCVVRCPLFVLPLPSQCNIHPLPVPRVFALCFLITAVLMMCIYIGSLLRSCHSQNVTTYLAGCPNESPVWALRCVAL